MNNIATKLLEIIDEYIKESSKKDYVFSLEEQLMIQKKIQILEKQIEILIDYETKRK